MVEIDNLTDEQILNLSEEQVLAGIDGIIPVEKRKRWRRIQKLLKAKQHSLIHGSVDTLLE